MPDIDIQNIQTYHAALVVKALAAQGLEHVIISPGSRSTPLTLAFAAHPKVKSHVVIDERSAAFVALGIASATGKPAALVCTSGTAVANYFPAVAEAQKSGLPMLVLSADRDFNEMNTGANQWIDQINVFGNKAVFFAQVKPRENDPRDISRLEYIAHQAWNESTLKGGCAHLNFPFRKPLEPTGEFLEDLVNFYKNDPETEFSISRPVFGFKLDATVEKLINNSSNPVIIATGGIRNSTTIDLIRKFTKAGVPVLAEAGSIGSELTKLDTFIDGANTFLRHESTCTQLTPDLIIRFGDEPIGKGILTYLKVHQNVQVIRFIDRLNWSNSTFSPEIMVLLAPDCLIDDSVELGYSQKKDWLPTWKIHETAFADRRNKSLSVDGTLRDGDVYRVLSQFIGEDEHLFVSNSFPARDIDYFGDLKLKSRKMYMNRGASGIDGIISTSLGISLSSRSPITLIVGDLAFAHDLSALIPVKNFNTQLRIIVINNNGGGIFEMLPVENSEHFDEYFRTSQHIDAYAMAKAAGLNSTKVISVSQLTEALSAPNRFQVIECVTDQHASMMQRKALWG